MKQSKMSTLGLVLMLSLVSGHAAAREASEGPRGADHGEVLVQGVSRDGLASTTLPRFDDHPSLGEDRGLRLERGRGRGGELGRGGRHGGRGHR